MQTFQNLVELLQDCHKVEVEGMQTKYIDIAQKLQDCHSELDLRSRELFDLRSKINQYEVQESERTIKHVEKLALRCTHLQEKLGLVKYAQSPTTTDDRVQAKDKSILRLVEENTRLFVKIGVERHQNQIRELNLEQKINQYYLITQKHIPLAEAEKSIPIESVPHKSKPLVPEKPEILRNQHYKNDESASLYKINIKSASKSPVSLNKRNSVENTPKKDQSRLKKFRKSPKIDRNHTSQVIHIPPQSEVEGNSQEQSPPIDIRKTPLQRTISIRNNQATTNYHEVVRDKATRTQMHGLDCACCSDVFLFNQYYRLSKDVKPILELGAPIQSAVQRNSRHRVWSKRPSTPPGYQIFD